MPELLNCPFCNGKAVIPTNNGPLPMVVCVQCGAGTSLSYTVEEAVEKWNRRDG